MFSFFRKNPTEEFNSDIAKMQARGIEENKICEEEWRKIEKYLSSVDDEYRGREMAFEFLKKYDKPLAACEWGYETFRSTRKYDAAFKLLKVIAESRPTTKNFIALGEMLKNKMTRIEPLQNAKLYFQKAADLGDESAQIYLASESRKEGDRSAAIQILTKVIDASDNYYAKKILEEIYGTSFDPHKVYTRGSKCAFCDRWFENPSDVSFVLRQQPITDYTFYRSLGVCWQCMGAYDEGSLKMMLEVYMTQDPYALRGPEYPEVFKYQERDRLYLEEVVPKFLNAWEVAARGCQTKKHKDWESLFRKVDVNRCDIPFANLTPCVCCEHMRPICECTDIRFSGGDKTLCKTCIRTYDLSSLRRAASHWEATRPIKLCEEEIIFYKRLLGSEDEKTLPHYRRSRFVQRHIESFGGGNIGLMDNNMIFDD